MAKTTWDVWVVLANDPSQTVAYLPRWRSIQFSDQLNEVGSATIEHDFSDPFFAAFQEDRGDSLLDGPYALQIRRDGIPVFTFFIEDVQVDRAGTRQPLVMGGRGIATALEWGIVLPEDFSNQARVTAGTTQRPKFFDRLFPGYSYNVRVATTGPLSATYANGPQQDVPGAGARLTATSNGNINNSGIDGVTDLVVGDNILVKDQVNTAHNGIYWIVTIGSSSEPWVLQRTARADGSPISDLELENSAFVNDGTTNGYTSWAITSNGDLESSDEVGQVELIFENVSLGSFTGISAFYILFKEADTGYEYSTKKATFGDIKTIYGRGGIGYAVDWPLALDSVLTNAMGKTDSKGRVVQDGGNFNIAVGRTLLDVLNEVATNTGVDWHVSAEGIISIAVRPFATETVVFEEPFGNDLTTGSAALLFSLPMLQNVETRTSVTDLRTVVYGSDGFNLDRQISDRTGTYGFREYFIENTADDAPAVANITAAAVRQVRDGKLQVTTTFDERDGMTAWVDFGIGDKVLVEIDTGVFSERIISAIGASIDENGTETIEVTFGDVFQDLASNLKYAANYGRLGAAEIPTFTLRGTSSRPTAPVGTSVGPEVNGMSNRVVATWEPPDNNSATSYEAIVYREEQNNSGSAVVYSLSDIYRDGNIAYVQLSSSANYSTGDLINIYNTASAGFDRSSVFLTSASPTLFTFSDVGPDIQPGTYTTGNVVRIVERHSTIVPSNQTSAVFENLAAPGREYNFTVVPYASNGQSGVPSPPFTFEASASPQILFSGAIRSNNYVEDTSGWTIESSGDAEFNTVTVRNGTWVQGTLTAPTLQTATVNPRIIVNSTGLYAYNNTGDIVTSISSTTGALFSSSASISGTITATALVAGATISSPVITGGTIDIGGFDTSSFHVDSAGNMWIGAATFAAAPFSVSASGAITATTGTFSGAIDIGGFDTTSFHVDTTGQMWIGAATAGAAKFRVSADGVVYAGSGGVVIDTNNITSGGAYTGQLGLGPGVSGDAQTPNPGLRVRYTSGLTANYLSGYYDLNGPSGGFIRADASGTPGVKVQVGAQSMELFPTGISFNGEERFAFTKGGPGTTLYAIVNGTDYYAIWPQSSDRRMKQNIDSDTTSSISKILNDVKLYEFNFKEEYDDPSLRHVGVMADEIEQIFPRAVYTNRLPGEETPESPRMVHYSYLVPHLLATVQHLDQRIKALEALQSQP